MNRAAIDWARNAVLTHDSGSLDPESLLFLLRDYISSGNAEVRDALEPGLTTALGEAAICADPCRRVQWLRLLAEAVLLSDDERMREALTCELPAAIDGLEIRLRRSYEPGEGLLGEAPAWHFHCASALLAAFDLTGRLPYAMLADELLQHARGRWWDDAAGGYDVDFRAGCAALRVTCRLAALHADPAYRAAAVLPSRDDCAGEAARLVAALALRSGEYPQAAGLYGAALLDWFALQPNLQ